MTEIVVFGVYCLLEHLFLAFAAPMGSDYAHLTHSNEAIILSMMSQSPTLTSNDGKLMFYFYIFETMPGPVGMHKPQI